MTNRAFDSAGPAGPGRRRLAPHGHALLRGPARCALRALAAGLILLAVLPSQASARWTRIAERPSGSSPYYVCPAQPGRVACNVIEDPTNGTNRRGPLPAGAITAGPEQEVSPALFGSGVQGGYAPTDLRSAYALPSASAGAGQTVAVVIAEDDPTAEADMNEYRHQYGIAPCRAGEGCFRKVNQTGGSTYPPAGPETAKWAREASIDLDMVSAICPNCRILLVEASSTQTQDLATAENEAVALGATEVNNSFLGEESPEEASAYDHPGIPITASAGDQGYGVGAPASYPGVIAVGGTSLLPAKNRGWSETVWGAARGAGTGSGCSLEPKPPWQTDVGCATRTMNDIAAVADPNTPVSVYDSYNTGSPWLLLGGTSVAAPIVAAAMALTTPYTRSFTGAHALYAQASAGGGAFNDITAGLDGSCGSYLCEARAGYDGPSGLGTLNGAPEVPPPTELALAATSITQTRATMNATVNTHGGEVHECTFEYGPAGGSSYPHSVPCAALPAPAMSPVGVSATVAGLSAGTAYHFRLEVSYAGGTGLSGEQAFTTLGPPPTVSTGGTSGLTASSVTLSGEVNPNGSPVGECRFEFGPTAEYGSTAPCTPSPGAGQGAVPVSAALTGLTAGRAYHYRLTAANANGGPSHGADRTVTLPPNPPRVLTGAAVSITSSSATLTATVESGGVPVSACEFEFNSSETFIPCSVLPGSGPGAVAVSAPAVGLRPGVLYRYRIIAANSGGSSYGNIAEFSSLPSSVLEPATNPLSTPAPVAVLYQAKLIARTLTVGHAGRLRATVRCPTAEANCRGTVRLETLGAGPATGAHPRRGIMTLAVGQFAGGGAGLGVVTLRLSPAARALLGRARLLQVHATVQTRGPSGEAFSWQAVVTLRVAGVHRRRGG